MTSDERRAAILQATLPLVSEHGANVTTRQVAHAAGIAEGTVFRVFTDKEELLRACVSEAFRTEHVCARIEEAAAEGDLETRLVEAALLFAEHFARLGELIQTLATTGHDVRPKHDATEDGPREFMRGLAETIARALEPDEHRFDIPVGDLARMLLGLIMSLRFDPRAEVDLRACVTNRVGILLHGALHDPNPSTHWGGKHE